MAEMWPLSVVQKYRLKVTVQMLKKTSESDTEWQQKIWRKHIAINNSIQETWSIIIKWQLTERRKMSMRSPQGRWVKQCRD